MDISIKDLIKDNIAMFLEYRNGYFFYKVSNGRDWQNGILVEYKFPIPLSDVEGVTLKASDKAITFMKWIKKAKDEETLVAL